MPRAIVLTSNFTHRTYNAVKRKLRPNFSMYRVVQFKPSCFTSNRRSKYSTYVVVVVFFYLPALRVRPGGTPSKLVNLPR